MAAGRRAGRLSGRPERDVESGVNNMTVANETAPSKLKLRPRPDIGLGAAWIGKEEEELVLQVLPNKEPFRYYGHDPAHPPQLAATLEKDFAAKFGFK